MHGVTYLLGLYSVLIFVWPVDHELFSVTSSIENYTKMMLIKHSCSNVANDVNKHSLTSVIFDSNFSFVNAINDVN